MSVQYFLAKQEAAPFIIPEVIPAKPDLTIEGIKNPEPVPQFIDTDTAKKLLLSWVLFVKKIEPLTHKK